MQAVQYFGIAAVLQGICCLMFWAFLAWQVQAAVQWGFVGKARHNAAVKHSKPLCPTHASRLLTAQAGTASGISASNTSAAMLSMHQLRILCDRCCCLQVDNKSTTDVPAVEFFLHQKLTLTAKTMWGSRDKSFQSTRIHQRCAA